MEPEVAAVWELEFVGRFRIGKGDPTLVPSQLSRAAGIEDVVVMSVSRGLMLGRLLVNVTRPWDQGNSTNLVFLEPEAQRVKLRMQNDRKSQDIPKSVDIRSVEFFEDFNVAIILDLGPDRRGPGSLSHSFRTT
jgi:hypothetical protein